MLIFDLYKTTSPLAHTNKSTNTKAYRKLKEQKILKAQSSVAAVKTPFCFWYRGRIEVGVYNDLMGCKHGKSVVNLIFATGRLISSMR